MMQHAVHLGDFSAERTVLIAAMPQESETGAQARGMFMLVGEDVSLTKLDHWAFQVGKVVGGKFQLVGREVAFDGPLSPLDVRRLEFSDPVLISRGEALAIRMSPRGLPSPLVGVSVIPDWGVLSTRSPTRAQ